MKILPLSILEYVGMGRESGFWVFPGADLGKLDAFGMYRKTVRSSRRWRKLDHTLEMLRYRKGNTGNLSRTVEARDNPWKGPRTAHKWSKHMSGFSLDVFCRVWLFVCFHQLRLHHVFFLIEAYPTAHHGWKNHRSSSQLKLGCKWILK